MIAFDGHGLPFMVDPNSTLGLRLEGWSDAARKKPRDANPFCKSHPGSPAQQYWFEGWDAFQQKQASLLPKQREETP